MDIGSVSFGGIASGLDVKSIITAIMNAERQPETLLQNQQAGLDSRRSAYADLNSRLTALRTALQDLSSSSMTSGRTATSSDTSVLTVQAGTGADTGNHQIEVTSLAHADRVRSTTLSNRYDPAITDGTVTIKSGSRDLISVNVSATAGNNSLVAVRDAINSANAGVTASIVNDGTGDLLVVGGSNTGTANALTITDTTNLGLTAQGHVLDTAKDAALKIDGISVSSASNTVTTAIPGVTLNLLAQTTSGPVTVNVAADTASIKTAIQGFVDAYNSVASFTSSQFTADATTGKAGVLAGDSLLRSVQEKLSSIVGGGVAGIPTSDLTTLGAIGISIDGSTGQLKINSTMLDAALSDKLDQVTRLFAATGRATDTAVSFAAVTSATNAGTYNVAVTTAAERATVAGSTAIGQNGLTQDESLTITAGTKSTTIALASGDSLATIVSKLNSGLASAGVSAQATADGGSLRINSSAYGSNASISVVSNLADNGDGSTTGIGTTLLNDTGVDVAGSINGVAATGTGTVLTGATGTAVEGLQVSVVTTAATIAAKGGDFGAITVTRGVADSLTSGLKMIVDPTGGLIASMISGIDTQTKSITDHIAAIEARLKDREALLTMQFNAADQAITALQQQQNALGKTYSLY